MGLFVAIVTKERRFCCSNYRDTFMTLSVAIVTIVYILRDPVSIVTMATNDVNLFYKTYSCTDVSACSVHTPHQFTNVDGSLTVFALKTSQISIDFYLFLIFSLLT